MPLSTRRAVKEALLKPLAEGVFPGAAALAAAAKKLPFLMLSVP